VADEALVLTVPEAARLLRIGRDLAYVLAAQGKLPALRLGRRLVVPRDALLRWISEEIDRPVETGACAEGVRSMRIVEGEHEGLTGGRRR
jgi:excisionase family DNA binding protein